MAKGVCRALSANLQILANMGPVGTVKNSDSVGFVRSQILVLALSRNSRTRLVVLDIENKPTKKYENP